MVVSIGETSQQHEHDKQQRDNEVDSMHDGERKSTIAKPDCLGRLFLNEQTPQALRLEDHKGDSDRQGLNHPAPENPLPLAANVETRRLKNQAPSQQQNSAESKSRRKLKLSINRSKRTGDDQQPGSSTGSSQSR